MPWKCDNCETVNESEILNCEVCGMQRVVKFHWNCPNCETVNPDYSEFCEVCHLEQSAATVIEEQQKKEGRIMTVGKYTKPSWEIPGVVKIRQAEKIAVYKPKTPMTLVDEKDWRPFKPVARAYNKFRSWPAKKKKRALTIGAAISGVMLFNLASGFMFVVFLLAMGWMALNYRYGASFRKRADKWLDPEYREPDGFREEVKYLEKYEEGHQTGIMAMTFSATGDQLVSVDKRGIMIRWDVEMGEKRKRKKLLEPGFYNMVIGKTAAFAREFNMVKAYRPDGTLKGQMKVSLPAAPDNELILSREQGLLALGSNVGDIVLWETRNLNQKERVLNNETKDRITGMDFFPGGKFLLSGNERGAILVWGIDQNRVTFMDVRSGVYVTAVAVSHTGSHFAAAYSDGEVRTWSHSTNREASRFNLRERGGERDSNQYARFMLFLPTRNILATADQHGLVQLWSWQNEEEVQLLKNYAGRSGRLRSMVISRGGRWIAVAGDDGIISMFDLSGRSRSAEAAGPETAPGYLPE